jgi:hypothetical protein
VRTANGDEVWVKAKYFRRARKRWGNRRYRGFYLGLLLLGINGRCTDVDQVQQYPTPLQRSNRDTGLLKRIRALIADEQESKNDGIIDPHSRQLGHAATEI